MDIIETAIESEQQSNQIQIKNNTVRQGNKVQLNNIQLKREQIKSIIAGCSTENIEHLLFWDNAIGNQGLRLLSTINWSGLKVLRLAQNNITVAAIKYLNSGNFASVTEMSLYKNPLGNQSIKQLSKGQWYSLEKLLLHDCNLTSQVTNYLALGNWKNLTHVNLGFNKIESIAVMTFANIEQKEHAKKSIILVKNNMKGAIAISIGQTLNCIKIST